MRIRIGIFIGSEFHARSLIESGVLNSLINEFEVTVLTKPSLKMNFITKFSNLNLIELNSQKKMENLFNLHLKLGTVRYFKRSNSYKFRIKRYILGDYYPEQNLKAKIKWLLKTTIKAINMFLRFVISRTYFFSIIQKEYISSIELLVNRNVFIDKFDLLLSWCQSSEPTALAPIVFGQKYGIPNMVVVDNWDNLSSKSIFPLEPDNLVCFGNQSVDFARRIQNFNNCKIYPIGSARFEVYRDVIGGNIDLEPKDYLYAGSSIALEDEEVLSILHDYSISLGRDKAFRYRRHPYPQGPVINIQSWKEKFSSIKFEDTEFLDSLENTRNSLSRSKVLIAMPTTFVLEGLLCGIPTILLSLRSEKIRTNSENMLQNLEHLFGIESIKTIKVARKPSEIIDFVNSYTDIRKIEYIESIKNYLTWSNKNFDFELINAIYSSIKQ